MIESPGGESNQAVANIAVVVIFILSLVYIFLKEKKSKKKLLANTIKEVNLEEETSTDKSVSEQPPELPVQIKYRVEVKLTDGRVFQTPVFEPYVEEFLDEDVSYSSEHQARGFIRADRFVLEGEVFFPGAIFSMKLVPEEK